MTSEGLGEDMGRKKEGHYKADAGAMRGHERAEGGAMRGHERAEGGAMQGRGRAEEGQSGSGAAEWKQERTR